MIKIYKAVSPILEPAGWTELEITSWILDAFHHSKDDYPTKSTLEEWKSAAIATLEERA